MVIIVANFSARKRLCQLLDSVLEMQASLTSKMEKTGGVSSVCGDSIPPSSDEEVPSDEEEGGVRRGADTPYSPELRGLSRKRKRLPSRATPGRKRDYAGEIARGYEALRPYRNDIISKWNEKTKLATGKVTSKVGVVKVWLGPSHTFSFLFWCSRSWKWIAQFSLKLNM